MTDVLEQLAEHLTTLAEQLPTLLTEGDYLWFRPVDNTFHATAETTAPQPADVYLFDAFGPWKQQWNGDWDAAAEALVDALAVTLSELQGGH